MTIKLKNIEYFFQAQGYLGAGQITVEHLAALKEQGVKTIINIRGLNEDDFSEIEKTCSSLGLNYLHIEFFYEGELCLSQMQKIAQALDDSTQEHQNQILIHCKSSNRVGAFYFYYFYKIKNFTKEKSLELAKELGLASLEPKILNFVSAP